MKDWKELQQAAFFKGVLDIDSVGGKILVRSVDEPATKFFDTFDEVKRYIIEKKAPSNWQKEISNLNRAEIDTVVTHVENTELRHVFGTEAPPQRFTYAKLREHVRSWDKAPREITDDMSEAAKTTARKRNLIQNLNTNAGQLLFRPTYRTMRRLSNEVGAALSKTDQDALVKLFEGMEKQIKVARGMQFEMRRVMGAIVPEGMQRSRLPQLRVLIENPPSKWDEIAKAHNLGDITDIDREFLRRYKVATDRLGTVFGIDGYKMAGEYLSRLKEFAADNVAAFTGGTQATRGILKQVFGTGDLPKEIRFFAQYLRADDLYNFIQETDPMDILHKYISKGVKNLTLGKTYEDTVRFWTDTIKTTDPRVTYTVGHYLESVMGMYSDEASKISEQIGGELSQVLARKLSRTLPNGTNPKALKDAISILHNLTIAATMSFRPWLPIRNMQQIWTTLAGHFGNGLVMDALKQVNDPKRAEELFTRLVRNGRFQDTAPIYGFEAEGAARGHQQVRYEVLQEL
jgi:hypothetical protein